MSDAAPFPSLPAGTGETWANWALDAMAELDTDPAAEVGPPSTLGEPDSSPEARSARRVRYAIGAIAARRRPGPVSS